MTDTQQNRLYLTHNFFTQSSGDFHLGDFQGYKDVSLWCEWSDLSNLDCVIKFVMKGHGSQSEWIEIPILTKTLDTISGVCQLRNKIFSGRYVGIRIANNTEYSGILKVYINAE